MTAPGTALAVIPRTVHALQLQGSLTTGLISVHCPCQEDAIESRSPAAWWNGERVDIDVVFAEHVAKAEEREAAKSAPPAEADESVQKAAAP